MKANNMEEKDAWTVSAPKSQFLDHDLRYQLLKLGQTSDGSISHLQSFTKKHIGEHVATAIIQLFNVSFYTIGLIPEETIIYIIYFLYSHVYVYM